MLVVLIDVIFRACGLLVFWRFPHYSLNIAVPKRKHSSLAHPDKYREVRASDPPHAIGSSFKHCFDKVLEIRKGHS